MLHLPTQKCDEGAPRVLSMNHLLKPKLVFGMLLLSIMVCCFSTLNAQNSFSDCAGIPSCADPDNFGANSEDPATLSYDNMISSFHQSAGYGVMGEMLVWGQYSKPSGTGGSFLTPTAVNRGNFPDMTGNPIRIGMGSRSLGVQFVLLTDDDKLWVWGERVSKNHRGAVVDTTLISPVVTGGNNTTHFKFQQLIPNNNNGRSLPDTLHYSDVKMLFVTWGTIAITTCAGDVWVLSQNDKINQGKGATSWVRVNKDNGSGGEGAALTNVVATRGSASVLMALTNNGEVYTWGYQARIGDGDTASDITFAKQMSLPATATGSIKMIGATNFNSANQSSATMPRIDTLNTPTYYILYKESGKKYGQLWALGENEKRQLGIWNTTASNSWVQPRYESTTTPNTAGDVMDDIVWISPQEHDMLYPFINTINNDSKLVNWGAEAYEHLGRGVNNGVTGSTGVNPGFPDRWSRGLNEEIMAVESGGHTTMVLRKCSSTFGYMGHRISGSMGDNESGDIGGIDTVIFETSPLQICGARTLESSIEPNTSAPYCKNNNVQFSAPVPGGKWLIHGNAYGAVIDSVTGLLDVSNIVFGSGSIRNIRVDYQLPLTANSCAGAILEYLIPIEDCIAANLDITGMLWMDVDGNAQRDTLTEPGISNDMWAALIGPDSLVIGYAKVDSNGFYKMSVSKSKLGQIGDYSVILTNNRKNLGDYITELDLPRNNYNYTGTNKGLDSMGIYKNVDSTNHTGKVILGDLSGYASGPNLGIDESYPDNANFGLRLPNTTNAVNDENSTWENTPVSGDVTTNDFDIEGDTQTFGTFLNPNGGGNPLTTGDTISGVDALGNPVANAGALSFNNDGTYTFIPADGFTGAINVPYSTCDDGDPVACDTAVLSITVSPSPTASNSVIANNDEYYTYGNPVNGNVLVNDADPQGDSFNVIGVNQGSVSIPIGVGTPVSGVDENGNPVANAGTLTQNVDGTMTFVPASGFAGTVTYTYKIKDDNATDPAFDDAAVVITVLRDSNGPKNDPPFAGDDFVTTKINTPVTGNFIGNDTDPNGDSLSLNGITIDPNGPKTAIGTPVTTTKGGTVIFYSDGSYDYTPPVNYVGPDDVTYEVCDVTNIDPQPLCANATIHMLIGGVSLSGTVYHDSDGLTDNNISTSGSTANPGTNVSTGNPIYAILTNDTGLVLQSVAVNPDGTYKFDNVAGGSVKVVLSETDAAKGSVVISSSLPSNWVSTGENNANGDNNNYGIVDGISSVTITDSSVNNLNFGIEQLPYSDNKSQTVNQPLGVTIPAGAITTSVSGNDPEDGILGNSNTIVITTLPSNGVMYYNGVAVTQNQEITGFDPSLLSIDGLQTGTRSTVFEYAFKDAAGKQDPSPATYTIDWPYPLAIKLLAFTAQKLEQTSLLNWVTASENDNHGFEIERSLDGKQFHTLGFVHSKAVDGRSEMNLTYDYTDQQPFAGLNYYRLKQLDIDGQATYSEIRKVLFPSENGISLYPNPVKEQLTIEGISKGQTVIIYNGLGQEVSRMVVTTDNSYKVNVSYLPAAHYQMVIVSEGSAIKTFKFVKK